MHLTAEHFAIGDKVETKKGKKGVITHIHKKAGYLFIHDPGESKTYHVSWGSVTKINGKEPAASDDPNRKADQPKEKPSSAPQGGAGTAQPKTVAQLAKEGWGKGDVVVSHNGEEWTVDHGVGLGVYATSKEGEGPKALLKWNEIAKHTPAKKGKSPAADALKAHGWMPVKTDSMGAVTYAHPKLGGQFHVDVDGTLINADSGTEIKPEQAAEYMRGTTPAPTSRRPARRLRRSTRRSSRRRRPRTWRTYRAARRRRAPARAARRSGTTTNTVRCSTARPQPATHSRPASPAATD
jgi:hypothetical protein